MSLCKEFDLDAKISFDGLMDSFINVFLYLAICLNFLSKAELTTPWNFSKSIEGLLAKSFIVF